MFYGIDPGGWKFIGFVFILGFILLISAWLVGPPALVTATIWLAAPRLGWTGIQYSHVFGYGLGGWAALNLVFVALASYPEWAFWQRRAKSLWNK